MHLTRALIKANGDLEHATDAVEVPDSELPPGPAGDSDSEVDEPMQKESRVDAEVTTLRHILQKSGFSTFMPPAKDSEQNVFKRVSKLRPYLHAFACMVRVEEKILSKAKVIGKLKPMPPQQQYEHDLANARAEFHCSASRQSRHSLWCDFSSRVIQAAKTAEEQDEDGLPHPVKEIKYLMPSSSKNEAGHRQCQIVVIRPSLAAGEAGSLRFGNLEMLYCTCLRVDFIQVYSTCLDLLGHFSP